MLTLAQVVGVAGLVSFCRVEEEAVYPVLEVSVAGGLHQQDAGRVVVVYLG